MKCLVQNSFTVRLPSATTAHFHDGKMFAVTGPKTQDNVGQRLQDKYLPLTKTSWFFATL